MSRDNNSEETVNARLLEAVKNDDAEEVKHLLSKGGVDLTTTDKDGHTPLSLAAWNGNEEIAELLLAQGADINAKNRQSQTPLGLAVRNGLETSIRHYRRNLCAIKFEFVKFLIDKGADVNLGDNCGITPLVHAAYVYDTKIAKLLIDKGAEVNAEDVRGNTAFSIAIKSGRQDLVKLLLDNGARVRDVDIEAAEQIGNKEIVELLMVRNR